LAAEVRRPLFCPRTATKEYPTPTLRTTPPTMADEELNLYDEIEIEDCFYDEVLQIYHHPCPCGDRFEISIADMRDGEDIARCPSCSLMIRIIFDAVRIPEMHFIGLLLTFCSPTFHQSPRMTHRRLPLSLRRHQTNSANTTSVSLRLSSSL